MAIWYLMLALMGFYDATSHIYYYLVLILTGVSNAFLLPTFITINANWFPIADSDPWTFSKQMAVL